MERDPAARQQRPGLRLADVVQQRGQPQPQIPLQAVARLQLDRLVEHGQRVPVDVLVPMVLVDLEAELRHLGQEVVGRPGPDQQVEPADGPPGRAASSSLVNSAGDPLGRDDLKPGRELGHRRGDFRRRLEPELGHEPGGPQDPQRIVVEGVLRRARGAQQRVPQVSQAAERVDQLMRRAA